MANQHTTDKSPWNDERNAELARLVATGITAQEIAEVMGQGLTRNAVIGKAGRLKLKLRQPHGVRPEGPRPKKLQNTPPQRPIRAWRFAAPAGTPEAPRAPETAPAPALEPPPIDSFAGVSGRLVTIMELKPHHCRWPMWGAFETRRVYCGINRAEPHPYCAGHARVAYPNR